MRDLQMLDLLDFWLKIEIYWAFSETVKKCVTGRGSCYYENSCDLDVPNVVFKLSAAGHVKSLSTNPKEVEKVDLHF